MFRDLLMEQMQTVRDRPDMMIVASSCVLTLSPDICPQVLKGKIPFMYEMIHDWHTYMASGKELDALAFATGIVSDVDPFLMQTLQPLCRKFRALAAFVLQYQNVLI